MSQAIRGWAERTFGELARALRWSFLPPLMVNLAAGISGLTQIVGTFFVKDYLDHSAAFLAGLSFWAGLPWVMKMPPGHLVDLICRRKAVLVWLGAGMIALSASQLATKYLNEIFVVEREVADPKTGAVTTPQDYSELGMLLIAVALVATVAPLITVWLIPKSRFRTEE